jgi:hypothetical protein
MRALVVVACLVGCGASQPPAAEPAATHKAALPVEDAPNAELPLHWVGEWSSLAEQVTFSFDIRLTAKGNELTGRILWTLLSVPPGHFLAPRVGDSATEYVKGTWSPEKQELRLIGTSVDSPGFLVVDEYKLLLSRDHSTFDGRTRGSKGDWMNSITGRLAPP